MATKSSRTDLFVYEKIAREVEEEISIGKYARNSKMMSEAELSARYNVSRVTARKAYRCLMDKGILRAVQGKGTFVNDVITKDWSWMRSFTVEVSESGRIPTTKFAEFEIIRANEDIAKMLDIRVGTECFYMSRIRMIDNFPVWLTKSYVPCSYCPKLTKDYFSVSGVTQSIFKVMHLNFGTDFAYKEELTQAVNISSSDADVMGIIPHKPVISTALLARDRDRKPILYENTLFESR